MSEAGSSASLLLVDDRPANLVALEAVLEPLGQRLVRANSGAAALELVASEEFAVILLDARMPGLDGLTTAERIRQIEYGRTTPVIFLTAHEREHPRILRAYRLGAVDYLTKPFEPEVLRAKVGVLVDLYLARRKAREQAARAEARERALLERFFERAPAGLAIFEGPEHRFAYANAFYRALAGGRELLGRRAREALPEMEGRGFFERLDRVYATGEPDEGTDVPTRWSRRGDGSAGEAHLSLMHHPYRVADGPVAGLMTFAFDVSELVRARAAAQSAEAERATLLARETEARARAEEASRLKDEFLATLSHELRTPLNAMLGWTRLLRSDGLPEEKRPHALEVIERNVLAQARLVDELLDVSRVVSGNLRVEPVAVDLAEIVAAAAESLRPAMRAKAIEYRAALDPAAASAIGDPHRLQQVVWNLLSNAIKFTPKGGRVEARLAGADADHVALTVADSGQGIEPAFLPFVFERFRQQDGSTTRAHGGLGLGLAIARHLIELHGGTVEAHSDGPGRGAAFTVRLPRSSAAVAAAPPPAPPSGGPAPALALPPELAGLRVLVVDDEPDARGVLVAPLEAAGARVTGAASAAEARDAFARDRPDLVLSDIGMPGEDGYALISSLRALPPDRGGATPAVAITAYARPEDRARALAAGYQAHLPKPVEPADLLAVVADLARRAPR